MRILYTIFISIIISECSAISLVQAQTEPRPISEEIRSYLDQLRNAGYLINHCKDSAGSDEEFDKFWDLSMKKRATEEWVAERFNNEDMSMLTFDYVPDSDTDFHETIAEFVNDKGGCTDTFLTELSQQIDIIKSQIIKADPTEVELAPWWMLLIWLAIFGILVEFAKFILNLFKSKRN